MSIGFDDLMDYFIMFNLIGVCLLCWIVLLCVLLSILGVI